MAGPLTGRAIHSFPESMNSTSRSDEGQADDLVCRNIVMGKMSKVSKRRLKNFKIHSI